MTGFLLIATAFFVLNIAIGVLVANYGASKGFPFAPVMIASVFISFPIVLLAVALMPPRPGFEG